MYSDIELRKWNEAAEDWGALVCTIKRTRPHLDYWPCRNTANTSEDIPTNALKGATAIGSGACGSMKRFRIIKDDKSKNLKAKIEVETPNGEAEQDWRCCL